MRPILTSIAAMGVATLAAAACAGDDDGEADRGRPEVVVTSTILGDIVEAVAGESADVSVLLPLGADPHEFAPSARQAEEMASADLLVQSGAGFEGGLTDAVESAEESGVELFTVADHVEMIEDDPHVWTDPTRLVPAIEALGHRLTDLTGDVEVETRAAQYIEDLAAVDAEIEATLAPIPLEDRVLVTNHEALAYFADRYGFEVLGAVIPSITTGAQPSAGDIDALAEIIDDEGVPAIFAETTSNADLARALADTVGDIEVVTLHTESLGDAASGADTYLGLLRTNAELIRDALT